MWHWAILISSIDPACPDIPIVCKCFLIFFTNQLDIEIVQRYTDNYFLSLMCKLLMSNNPCLGGAPAEIPWKLLWKTYIHFSHEVFEWSWAVTCEGWIEIYWLRFLEMSTLALVVYELRYPGFFLYNPSLSGVPAEIPFLYLHSFRPWSFQMVQSSYMWGANRSLLVQISILGTLCHALGSSHCRL